MTEALIRRIIVSLRNLRDWTIAQFFFLFIAILKLFPADKAIWFVSEAARGLGMWYPRTKLARDNLKLAFPQKSDEEIEQILRDTVLPLAFCDAGLALSENAAGTGFQRMADHSRLHRRNHRDLSYFRVLAGAGAVLVHSPSPAGALARHPHRLPAGLRLPAGDHLSVAVFRALRRAFSRQMVRGPGQWRGFRLRASFLRQLGDDHDDRVRRRDNGLGLPPSWDDWAALDPARHRRPDHIHRRAWRLFLSRSGWRDALTWRRAHCVSRVTRAGPAWDGFL